MKAKRLWSKYYRTIMASVLLMVVLPIVANGEQKPDGAAGSSDTKIEQLMNKTLGGVPGKEGTMITVEYAPGASTLTHRHNADVFVYVLEGSIVMQAEGGPVVTLGPGQTFYEAPNDIHAVSRNASNDKPAKFLVFIVKDEGAPVLVPAQ